MKITPGLLRWLLPFRDDAAIESMVRWAQALRQDDRVPPPAETVRLPALVRAVSDLAHDLAEARARAEQEARLRLRSESVWTPERLKEFARGKLKGRPLFAVSNREPYRHVRRNGRIECVVPPSGLVTALEPVLRASGGLWVAQASGGADMEVVDARGCVGVPPEDPSYTLKRITLSPEDNRGFYEGFSNEGLWPLCHIAHTRPIFRQEDWEAYERANRRFADAVLEEIGEDKSPLVLIQDYHFALLPRMLRRAKPDARIALFWHIPWPNPEIFGICPWKEAVLDGLLGADILGFHLRAYCMNFVGAVDRFLQSRIVRDRVEVVRAGHSTQIRPYPIGIAFTDRLDARERKSAAELKAEIFAEHGVRAEFLGVGVDRLDYTKGILERFWAIERFLKENPSYVGRFTFVELGAPSRSQIQSYSAFAQELDDTVSRINGRFATADWRPIVFLKDQHDQPTLQRYYRAAELCLVTSLHDGMNLVAMEYVASRSDIDGVLVLSRFAGAAEDLTDALLINPYDIAETTQAVRTALEMTPEERRRRMTRMRQQIKEHNVFKWAGDLIDDLCRIHPEVPVA